MTEWVARTDGSTSEIRGEKDLRRLLGALNETRGHSLVLEHKSGKSLAIAVEGPFAHVMFGPASSDDPMLGASALPPDRISKRKYVKFIIGGTPTRILKDLCIPIMKMVDVAVFFFKHKSLPSSVNWVKLNWP